jgi:hypothetical protein
MQRSIFLGFSASLIVLCFAERFPAVQVFKLRLPDVFCFSFLLKEQIYTGLSL